MRSGDPAPQTWALDQYRFRSGQAAVEFALLGSVLLLLFFGLLELGLLFQTRLVLAHAARVGLRQAVVDGGASPRAVRVFEDQLRLGGVDPRRAEVSISPRHAFWGTTVTLRARLEEPLRTPLRSLVPGGRVVMEAVFSGRSENLGRWDW